jgi:hypothetical protein
MREPRGDVAQADAGKRGKRSFAALDARELGLLEPEADVGEDAPPGQ